MVEGVGVHFGMERVMDWVGWTDGRTGSTFFTLSPSSSPHLVWVAGRVVGFKRSTMPLFVIFNYVNMSSVVARDDTGWDGSAEVCMARCWPGLGRADNADKAL